jgi:hypothetical protein
MDWTWLYPAPATDLGPPRREPVSAESDEAVLSFGTPETEPKPKAVLPPTGKR